MSRPICDYEGQQFNATSNEPQLNRKLLGSSLAETYSRKWGKLSFDEKLRPTWHGMMRAPSPQPGPPPLGCPSTKNSDFPSPLSITF